MIMNADDYTELRCRDHFAWVCPSVGANCIRLHHHGAELLQTPSDREELFASPCLFGTPILVPPNRIADGRFQWEGRTYGLDINEPSRHNHIHGHVMDAPFQTTRRKTTDKADTLTLRYDASGDPRYAGQRLCFALEVTYTLSENGLYQTIRIINGPYPLPMGLGQHTALRIALRPDARPEDTLVRIPAANEWTLSRTRIHPTGERRDTPLCAALRAGRFTPCGNPVSALITLQGAGAELLSSSNVLSYRTDGYPFMMLWNQGGSRSFICCEPQTWVIDAPNLTLPAQDTGFVPLLPYGQRTLRTCLRLVKEPKNTAKA